MTPLILEFNNHSYFHTSFFHFTNISNFDMLPFNLLMDIVQCRYYTAVMTDE